jgi:hypothetical protein
MTTVRPPVDKIPAGLQFGFGAVSTAGAVTLAAALPPAMPETRLAVVAVAVGLFATYAGDVRPVLGVTAIAALLVNGFLVDRLGVLAWHGPADLGRCAVLLGAAVAGLIAGRLTRTRRMPGG